MNNTTDYRNFCHSIHVPSSADYFENIPHLSLVFIVTCAAIAFCLLLVYIGELVVVFKYISSDSCRAGQIAWLLAVYPVTSILSVVGACIPRAMPITNMFMLLFFARLLFVYTQLIIDLFGGRIAMATEVHNTSLNANVGPCCCCMPCLPKIKPTIIHIRRIELLVYQAAVLRPIIFFAGGAVWADLLGEVETNNAFFRITSVINLLSTFTAMYGYNLFANMAAGPLKDFSIKTQMKLMQMLMLLCNLQGNVLEIMAGPKGPIFCDKILPGISRASLFNFLLLPMECVVLSLGTAWFLRPEVNAIFDLHPKWKRKPSAKEVNMYLMKRERESVTALANGRKISERPRLSMPHAVSAPVFVNQALAEHFHYKEHTLPLFDHDFDEEKEKETNI